MHKFIQELLREGPLTKAKLPYNIYVYVLTTLNGFAHLLGTYALHVHGKMVWITSMYLLLTVHQLNIWHSGVKLCIS